MFKREISSDTTKIISGKVIFENLKYYQVIALRADTKGVCTAVYPDRLMLSFEVGDNKNIVFSIPKSQGSYDVYQMMKEDIYGNPTTTIMYDGHIYNMILKYNFLPRLMIRKRVIEKQDHDSRIMKGRSIN